MITLFSLNKLCHMVMAILISIFLFSCENEIEIKSKKVIMAYYVPSTTYRLEEIPFEKLTHIIFSFTEVIDNKMKFKNESFDKKLRDLVTYKKQYPKLKIMIACGGWGGCAGFSDMANDAVLRKGFVTSTIEFIKKYNLDGVDMDWEYPGMKGAGNAFRKEDTQSFTALMKELREAMDITGKELILTFASAGWEKYYDHIETLEVMKYANFMNIMTYDMAGGGSPVTAHHTNLSALTVDDLKGTPAYDLLEKSKGNFKPRSAQSIVDFCLNMGVKPEQIVIGGAFYGRGWKGVPPINNGLYQKNNGVWKGWAQYSKIKVNYENKGGFKKYWDSMAQAPYLYNPKDSLFISYDDTKSVALKTKYVKEKGLGGMMFWQLTNDAKEDGLLDALHEEMTKK